MHCELVLAKLHAFVCWHFDNLGCFLAFQGGDVLVKVVRHLEAEPAKATRADCLGNQVAKDGAIATRGPSMCTGPWPVD